MNGAPVLSGGHGLPAMQHNQTTGAAAGPSSGVAMTVKGMQCQYVNTSAAACNNAHFLPAVEQAAPMALDTGVAEVIDITGAAGYAAAAVCIALYTASIVQVTQTTMIM